MACLPVTGLTPRFARVAAMIPRSRAVTEAEHCWKYNSTAGVGSLGEDFKVAQHVTDGAVAMAGLALGTINGFIEPHLAAGVK